MTPATASPPPTPATSSPTPPSSKSAPWLTKSATAATPAIVVTYVVDTNLNYTNLCDAYCSFCAFYRPHTSKADDAYTHTVDQMMTQVAAAAAMGCTTVLMQGGLNPELPLEYYLDMVRTTRERFPGMTPHYWSAPEIYEMSKVSGLDYRRRLPSAFGTPVSAPSPAAAPKSSPTRTATASAPSR